MHWIAELDGRAKLKDTIMVSGVVAREFAEHDEMMQTAQPVTQKCLQIFNLRMVSVSCTGEKIRGTSAWNASVADRGRRGSRSGTQEYARINSSQPIVPRCYLLLVGDQRFCNVPRMVSLVGESDRPDMRQCYER